jgi:hypothetical protein
MAVQYVRVGYIRAGGRRWGIIQASGWSWWLPTDWRLVRQMPNGLGGGGEPLIGF